MDESELAARLNEMHNLSAGAPISRYASPALLEAIRSFITTGALEPAGARIADECSQAMLTEHHERV
jgi:hypothetical protein